MRIGICGAHRVGKTTLANALVDRLGYEFLETRVGEFLEQNGLKVTESLETQELVRKHLKDKFKEYKRIDFISDRTPLDVLAYSSYMEDHDKPTSGCKFERHALKCFENTHKYFDALVLVQPGITLPDEEKNLKFKAQYNEEMLEYLNSSFKFLFGRLSPHVKPIIIPETVIDLFARIEFVLENLDV